MDIVVKGARPYDGSWPMIPFNGRERGQIKRLTGWLPTEYAKALTGGDSEFSAAIAVLAMRRAGTIDLDDVEEVFGRLLDADDATITLEGEDEAEQEGEQGRPPPESSNLKSDSSGLDTEPSSETSPPSTPDDNGTPASDISEFHPIRSVS
jgi:hypothetical protein